MAGLIVKPITSLDIWSKVLELRRQVFVDGQAVPDSMEVDLADLYALHVVATVEGRVVGTGRIVIEGEGDLIVPEHTPEDDMLTRSLAKAKLPRYRAPNSEVLRGRVGRMAVDGAHRRHGIGRLILGALEGQAFRKGAKRIVLLSQESAIGFYDTQGYVSEGEPLMEAGIRHIWMIKTKS